MAEQSLEKQFQDCNNAELSAESQNPPNCVDSIDGNEDKELDDLLDSALEDFDKPPPPGVTTVAPEVSVKEAIESSAAHPVLPSDAPPGSAASNNDLSSQQEALFNELFKDAGSGEDEGMDQIENMMKQFMTGQPQLMQQFEQLAQSADGLGETPAGTAHFEDTLQQTLGSMAQNAQDLQNTGMPQDGDLSQLLSGLGLDGSSSAPMGEDLDFMPMMQNMMKSLMSKEVLYPSLKDITDKYPAWLEENSGKVEKTEFEKYQKQYGLMKGIVVEFEKEKPEDSDDTKKMRFQKILDIMQSMQELGQPPKDIVGDMPPGLELDENGMPKLPASPDQCSVM